MQNAEDHVPTSFRILARATEVLVAMVAFRGRGGVVVPLDGQERAAEAVIICQ